MHFNKLRKDKIYGGRKLSCENHEKRKGSKGLNIFMLISIGMIPLFTYRFFQIFSFYDFGTGVDFVKWIFSYKFFEMQSLMDWQTERLSVVPNIDVAIRNSIAIRLNYFKSGLWSFFVLLFVIFGFPRIEIIKNKISRKRGVYNDK